MTPGDEVVEEVEALLSGRRVLVCVGGGIAAYKACEVVRLFVRAGAEVDVALTKAAREFVSPLTFQALSQRPVATDLLDAQGEQQIGHIGLADRAELVVVAPATADLSAKLRMGLADDVVTAAMLATRAPVLLAPSMNVHMWEHPATRENWEVLRQRGYQQVGPGSGSMACGHTGDGRLAEPWEIVRAAASVLAPKDLAGKRVLVTAGPTREYFDPVRFVSNPSSGRMGYALAQAAKARGADVLLISGPTAMEPPSGLDFVRIETAAELAEAVREYVEAADLVVMAAAVSDWRPAHVAEQKVKKTGSLEEARFERTQDILAMIGDHFEGDPERPLLVGFAAETEHVVEHAREKRERKKVDVVVANYVGEGGAFESRDNEVVVVTREGTTTLPKASKARIAWQILDCLVPRMRP